MIDFTEQPSDDGTIQLSWKATTGKEWNRVLELVKSTIPPISRSYNPDDRTWRVGKEYAPLLADIRVAAAVPDERIDQAGRDRALAALMSRDVGNMAPNQRAVAIYALKAAMGIIKTRYSYCLSTDQYGAYHAPSKTWFYSDGSYSGYSPSKKDQKRKKDARQEAKSAFLYSRWQRDFFEQGDPKIELRCEILKKFDRRCFICATCPKRESDLHMHRVLPGKRGGLYVLENIALLCRSCHKLYEGKSWDEIRAASAAHGMGRS